ncbi:MAG: hypothetical protein FWE72_04005 [Spirochaetaceae bacterium]|nr:hypothetical protein [Spirochaetaceae bacterium]
MKKLSMLVVLLVFASAFIFAGDWKKLQATSVVDVAVAENGFVAIANKAGELFTSKDAGVTWVKNPQASGIIRISLNSNATVMGIVNKNGEFYVSKDMGSSWLKTKATSVVDSSVGRTDSFIVNTKGEVFFTSDFENWTKTNAENVKIVVFGGPFIFIASKKGDSFVADYKKSPLMSYKKTQATSVVDLDVAPNGNLWIVNTVGEMFSSADKGTTWKKEQQATGVVAVSLCNKYTIIANKDGNTYIKEN